MELSITNKGDKAVKVFLNANTAANGEQDAAPLVDELVISAGATSVVNTSGAIEVREIGNLGQVANQGDTYVG